MIDPQPTLLKRITQLFSYSYKELWVFIASWFIYLKWDVLISLFNYKKWQKHLIKQQLTIESIDKIQPEFVSILTLIKINETAGRNHIRKMNCLRRCLCQKEMLNNRSIHSKLHIGVKFVNGKLAAHSWLTHNNQLINDSKEVISTYTELTKLDDKTLSAFI